MKTSTKVVIDKFAGGFIVALLKSISSIFSFRKTTVLKSPRLIVVCKFLGMGSIVQSTPLLQTFKKQFPEVRIIYLSSNSNKKLLEQITVIDELIIIDDTSLLSTIISTLSGIKTLWQKKADLFIDLEMYSQFSKIFAITSGAIQKYGLERGNSKKQNVYTLTFALHKDRPVSESYLEMCNPFFFGTFIHDLYNFTIDQNAVNEIKRKFILPEKYIIVNPNASDLRIERRWPKENFSELIGKIIETYPGKNVILIGSAIETEYVNEVLNGINRIHHKFVINTAGQLSIKELVALINKTELMITNDTGPMHLSFAANRPTIALFGPASPIQFGNHTAVDAIYKKVPCSPCVHDFIQPPCNGNNICMKQIEVAEVFGMVSLKLGLGQESRVNG